jgi:hypothetical protein
VPAGVSKTLKTYVGQGAVTKEPAMFNYFLQEFFSTVESGRYTLNDKKDADAVLLKEEEKVA